MAQPAVAAEVHQPLDVHRDFAAKVALHHVVAVDRLADLEHFRVGELVDAPALRDVDLLDDLARLGRADAVDVLQRDHDALVGRNVDACNACQVRYSFAAPRRRPCPNPAGNAKRPVPERSQGPGTAPNSSGLVPLFNVSATASSTARAAEAAIRRQGRVDRLRHRVDLRHAVDALQLPLAAVVVDQRRRLLAVGVEPDLERLRVVVGPRPARRAPASRPADSRCAVSRMPSSTFSSTTPSSFRPFSSSSASSASACFTVRGKAVEHEAVARRPARPCGRR